MHRTPHLVVLFLTGCAFGMGSATDEELANLFAEDQEAHALHELPDLTAEDRRRYRVLELIGEGRVVTPNSKYHAAMILQHTPRVWIGQSLSSRGAENYLLAHYLAKSAAEAGHKPARWLTAAAYDRYLVSTGKPQKYGTQFSLNRKTGRLDFDPVDPDTTDEERAEWNVPPIAETIQEFKERQRDGHEK